MTNAQAGFLLDWLADCEDASGVIIGKEGEIIAIQRLAGSGLSHRIERKRTGTDENDGAEYETLIEALERDFLQNATPLACLDYAALICAEGKDPPTEIAIAPDEIPKELFQTVRRALQPLLRRPFERTQNNGTLRVVLANFYNKMRNLSPLERYTFERIQREGK